MSDYILIDTNILIYLLKGDERIAAILQNKTLIISVISEIELLSLPGIDKHEILKINALLEICEVVNINLEVKQEAVSIRRKLKLKTVDSIVAATAKYMNIPLITADKGFSKLESEMPQVLIYKP
jgi:predicted nucleic acid-binding protein